MLVRGSQRDIALHDLLLVVLPVIIANLSTRRDFSGTGGARQLWMHTAHHQPLQPSARNPALNQ